MTEAVRTLSEREIEVLRLLATGATNQQIAEELVISINTVKVHVRNIFDKLGVQTRTEATLAAIRLGLTDLPHSALAETALPAAPLVEELPAEANGAALEAVATLETLPVPEPLPVVAPRRSRGPLWLAPLLALALVLTGVLVWRSVQATATPTPTPMPTIGEDRIIAPAVSIQKWRDLKPLGTPRGGLALVALSDGVYAIGGQTSSGVSGLVERYSFTDTWTPRAAKPTPVRDIQAVVVSGQIYVPGGCDAQGRPVDGVEVYSPAKDEWTTTARLPRPLCGYALAAVEGKIYLMGGWDGAAYHAETLVYTPGGGEWKTGPAMPTARAFAAAAVVDGEIHVVGGENGAPLATHEVLTPSDEPGGNTWTTRAPLPEPRSRLGLAAVSRRVYALGGGPASLGLASYDPSADAWRVEETAYSGEWRGLGVAAYDTRLYAMGGDGPLAVSRAYQALYQLIIPVGRP